MVATPEEIPTDLTLEIGDDLPPERFMAAARAFFGYVQELSQAAVPDGQPARWIVHVREGSTLLGLTPNPGVPPEVARIVYERAERGLTHLKDRGFWFS
jgi:hypothetical protein